jgi:mycothiol synthase
VGVDLAALAAAAGAGPGFTTLRWADRRPDDLLGSYAVALAGMNDAPTGGVDWRPVRPDPDRARRRESAHLRQGLRRFVVAARHDATGTVAGLTEVFVHPDRPRAEQGATTVLPAHRGHGLGLRLKADMVCWLAAEQPHVTGYETFTALDNPWMRAVNARLGHRPDGRWPQWQLTLG